MLNKLTVSALTAVLAVALVACGGGDKKTETTPPTTTEKTPETTPPEKTPETTTATADPTCEGAVAHGMGLVVKAGMVTQEKADAGKASAIEKCKKENPPKETLACVMAATDLKALQACTQKKMPDDNKAAGDKEPAGRR